MQRLGGGTSLVFLILWWCVVIFWTKPHEKPSSVWRSPTVRERVFCGATCGGVKNIPSNLPPPFVQGTSDVLPSSTDLLQWATPDRSYHLKNTQTKGSRDDDKKPGHTDDGDEKAAVPGQKSLTLLKFELTVWIFLSTLIGAALPLCFIKPRENSTSQDSTTPHPLPSTTTEPTSTDKPVTSTHQTPSTLPQQITSRVISSDALYIPGKPPPHTSSLRLPSSHLSPVSKNHDTTLFSLISPPVIPESTVVHHQTTSDETAVTNDSSITTPDRWSREGGRSESLMRLSLAFSGGVMMSAGLLHLLPDARSQLLPYVLSFTSHYYSTSHTGLLAYQHFPKSSLSSSLWFTGLDPTSPLVRANFREPPVAEAFAILGLWLIILIESISQFFDASHHHIHHSISHVHMHHTADECGQGSVVTGVDTGTTEHPLGTDGMAPSTHTTPPQACGTLRGYNTTEPQHHHTRPFDQSTSCGLHGETDTCLVVTTTPYTELTGSPLALRSPQTQEVYSAVSGRPVISFLLLLALSFHSLMEGLALGTVSADASLIGIAILAHKLITSFSLCVSIINETLMAERVKSTQPESRELSASSLFFIFKEIMFFALMTPIGVILGVIISRLALPTGSGKPSLDIINPSGAGGSSRDWALLEVLPGICTGLGAGTFLEVALVEVIGPEVQRCRSHVWGTKERWGMLGMWAIGSIFMGVLAIYV